MKVCLSWLRQYCDFRLSPAELARRLPELGMEIDATADVAGDTVFELAVTANRSDLLCLIGVAREIAAATGSPLRIPDVKLPAGDRNADQFASVRVDAPDLCPRYTARVVAGVKVAPSPPWLIARLESVGLRPVNNVVDITNFVLFECGQPLHAFDLDRLGGRGIVVRRAKPAENITVIDGSVRTLTDQMLVIADAAVPVAVAGVMGGLATEISGASRNILLESAAFSPANIRRTSRALGLASDSSYRFERGVDPEMVDWGSRRAAALIAEVAGGRVAEGMIDVGAPPPATHVVALRPDRATSVLGVVIPAAEQRALLERLGFRAVAERPGAIDFAVPSFREEVAREIDLIEEIARAYGYDRIPEKTDMRVRPVPVHKVDRVASRVRERCIGLGYSEVTTPSFMATDLAARFRHWSEGVNVIRNPVSREEPALRTTLIPSLLCVKKTNLNHGTPHVQLFELSRVYGLRSGEPFERTCLALLDDSGFASLRGALDAALADLAPAGSVACTVFADPNLAPGRAAQLALDGRPLGLLGEISDDLVRIFDLRNRPAVAELDFDLLAESARLDRRFQPLPRFPSIRRDLCIVLDESVAWADLHAAACAAAGLLAESITFLSEFRGGQIPPGKRALAFSVTCRAPDRTLTGDEADRAILAVAAALQSHFGAQIRAADPET